MPARVGDYEVNDVREDSKPHGAHALPDVNPDRVYPGLETTMRLTVLALAILSACCHDPEVCAELAPEPPPAAPYICLAAPGDAPAISVDNDTSWMTVVQQPLSLNRFVQLAQSCDIASGVTVSIAGWLPSPSKPDKRVVGLGFSLVASDGLTACLTSKVVALGGVAYK